MAGAMVAISTNSESEHFTHSSQISATIDQWRVQYARFIKYSSSTCSITHPALIPLSEKRRHGKCSGNWISTASAAAKLIYHRSSEGFDDAVLVISLKSRVLEEHYISKMQFSWPQVSCLSGYPVKGSRAVFVSYKDGVGQIQKFALRFVTIYETEKFMNFVKEILENRSPKLLQCPEFNSELSSQAEVIPSDGLSHRTEGDWQCETSVDHSSRPMFPDSEINAAQDSASQENMGYYEPAQKTSEFPPSFTELLKSCHPAVSESLPTESGDDLKTQFMRYLEETSFKELLATVESVVSDFGDDILL